MKYNITVSCITLLWAVNNSCCGQTCTFTYFPQDGTKILETSVRRSTEQIINSTNAPLHDEQNYQWEWLRQRKGNLVEIRNKLLSFSETLDGKPFTNIFDRVLQGSTTVYTVTSAGKLISATTDASLSDSVKSALTSNMISTVEGELRPDKVFAHELQLWNEKIAQYSGKTITIGDVLTNKVTSPDGQTMYWMIKFTSLVEKGGASVIQINSVASSDQSHLLRLQTANLNETERKDFFGWTPNRLPSVRLIVRTEMDVNTMDLIHYEDLLVEIYKSERGFKRKVENKISQFTFCK